MSYGDRERGNKKGKVNDKMSFHKVNLSLGQSFFVSSSFLRNFGFGFIRSNVTFFALFLLPF